MPKFGDYDFAVVVACGLTRFTRVFPCTKHIAGEETIKILLEEGFVSMGPPGRSTLMRMYECAQIPAGTRGS